MYGYNNGYGAPPPNNYGGDPYGPPPGPPPGHGDGYQNDRAFGFGSSSSGGGGGGFPGASGRTYGGMAAPPPGPPPGQYGGPPPGQYGGPPPGAYGGPPPQGPPPGAPPGYGPPQGGPYHFQPNQGGPPPRMQGGFAPPQSGPPQGVQHFSVPGNNNMSFQYSNCTGKRKALLIGINYFGSKNELKGCINDARAVSKFLKDKYGYREEDMVILTDDQKDPRSHPTKANILRGMQWLVAGAQTNDTLFLHFSGHGGQTEDTSGDEDDGYDEVIYPVDFQRAGHIVDDQIHDICVRPLMPGVRLTALFDSCHSGTVMDLPYVYSTQGTLKEPNMLKDSAQGLMSAANSYAKGDIGSVVKTVGGLFKKATTGKSATERTKQFNTSPADVIQISGCKDSQTSADASMSGVATGAMSYAFITVMAQDSNQSYISLLNNMRSVMQGRFSQKPQLSSSHPIDVNLKFIM
ncbi:hypothetical protein TRICI_002701 [Trichomonascus ciferrii]|uniref:Metacaspase-1 n=1 Tax=Trichomonascus ciferrii TaxID=44093 RepID=A0A642V5U4_9ASCO|nr:hypothetical protein TRICI_002701 [Trichomonascus ciferrii]